MLERKLRLMTGPLKFNKVSLDRKSKAAVFSWYADTELPNIALIKILVFRFGWPPMVSETCFTDAQ